MKSIDPSFRFGISDIDAAGCNRRSMKTRSSECRADVLHNTIDGNKCVTKENNQFIHRKSHRKMKRKAYGLPNRKR